MKKKLLFVINTMGRAGAEMALIELLKKLDSMKEYELYLYTILPCGELFERVPDGVHVLNKRISHRSVSSLSGHIRIARTVIASFFYHLTGFKLLGYMIKNIRQQKASGRKLQYDKLLWRLLADGRKKMNGTYDLAVSYIEGAATYFVADKVNAAHKAAFIHIDYEQAGYTPFMDRDCYKEMNKIYVVSNAVGEKFLSIYPMYQKKVRLFRNLLDKEGILRKADAGIGFTDEFDGTRLVTVGRLHYQKGYDIAIEALAKMNQDGYHIRWYIIGEGTERSNLELLIKQYGIDDSFILMGMKDNPYPYMKQADIYVHATRFEGKSIAIEEAQILGKTIAASDCTGNTEQITSGYDGVLFPLTVDHLVRELEFLIDNNELRKEYARHAAAKELEYPEDLMDMLTMLGR